MKSLKYLLWLFKVYRCDHAYAWIRNLHGDEIIFNYNGKRSEWYCIKCGVMHYKDELFRGSRHV